jgi:putative MATE family efflux protein
MSQLTDESVGRTITKMAIPMLAGTFSMTVYNLTNAWFVSLLGTNSLAAISFVFPVVMIIGFIMRGVGNGAMTLVAHALGARDQKRAANIATNALCLAAALGVLIMIAGNFTIEPIFARLGASGEVLVLTRDYMSIWYYGVVIMCVQSVACDMVVATGHTKAVSALMVISTVINAAFDAVLIFGLLGFPKMGIRGAAVATIISQLITLIAAGFILIKKYSLLSFEGMGAKNILGSWGEVMEFGIPGALGMILTPISSAVIVKLISVYGNGPVAACGVAGRIELFSFMIPMTVGMSLTPFIAQNYGAKRFDRIAVARKGAMTFALLYGLVMAVMFFIFAGPLAGMFSREKDVVDTIVKYICITCFGYGFLEVHRYAGFCMIGTHEPIAATALDIIRVVVLLIPLSIIGAKFFGISGIFAGRLATDILSGLIGIVWSGWILKNKSL